MIMELFNLNKKKSRFLLSVPGLQISCSNFFSDDYLPKAEELACGKDSFDNTRWILFDETAVSQQLAKDGSFEFFANSFMIEAE